MRVEYNLTKEDMVAWVEWARRQLWGTILTWLNGPGLLFGVAIVILAAGYLAMVMNEEGWTDMSRVVLLVVGFALSGGLLGIWWWNTSLPARLFSKLKLAGLTEDLTSEITPAGIRETSRLLESLVKWPMVKKIEATGEHLFLLLDLSAVVLIPRHGFASNAAYESFVDAARAYHADHLNG